jgi:hypothetical protein
VTVRPPRSRTEANRLDAAAERLAAIALRLKGYRILACRYRVHGGEIDIVARRADTIAFVEVKVRPTLDEAKPQSMPSKGGAFRGRQEAGLARTLGRRF